MVVTIRDEDIATYRDDGVACLRQVIPLEWIERLSAGLERNMQAPTERSRIWNRTEDGKVTFYDSQAWQTVDEYRSFVLESPMAELAARIMDVPFVNFFFDAIFVRSPGTQFRTPFHQDEPYWSVEGFDCCSAWMPLVPVAKQSCLELVRGSHRWNENYAKDNFGALAGDARDQIQYDDTEGLTPFPDIEGNRDQYDIVSWEMQPGDIILFNARTIHGGSGRLPQGTELRVFNTKWLGEDVRVCFRPEGMDPDHSEVMTELGLAPGDRISGDLYPRVWSRALRERAT